MISFAPDGARAAWGDRFSHGSRPGLRSFARQLTGWRDTAHLPAASPLPGTASSPPGRANDNLVFGHCRRPRLGPCSAVPYSVCSRGRTRGRTAKANCGDSSPANKNGGLRMTGGGVSSTNDKQSVSDAGKSVLDPFRCHGQLQEPGAGGVKHCIGDQCPHTDYGGFATPLTG